MKKKTLRDRLKDNSSWPEAQESAKRFAKFLVMWEEVQKSFREGWSYKAIWRVLVRDGDIDYGYSSFLNYIRKVKRRRLDYEKERARKAAGAAMGPAPAGEVPQLKPGSTKVEMPLFGKGAKPRDPKRF